MSEGAKLSSLSAFLLKHRSSPLFKSRPPGASAPGGPETSPEAEEFAADLEKLGPTFVKIGQMLSTRPDLVPPDYLVALSRLQDQATPMPFEQVLERIEAELGLAARKVFQTLEPVPIGTASFAQVHAAVLPSGRRVAVKVQRPQLAEQVENDLSSIGRLIASLGLVTGVGRRYGFREWLDEFRTSVMTELDYGQEADNLDAFRENLAPYARIHVPAPVRDYSTRRLLTMDLAEGIRVTAIPDVARPEADLGALANELGRAYLDQIFVHGLIHADPHPGNMVLTPEHELILLDLGMVAYVPPRMRDQLLKLVVATVDGRGEQVAETFAHMGTRLEDFDEARFTREIGRRVARYSSAGVAESEGSVLMDLIRIGAEAGLRPPAELAILGKTLLNLESVALALDPGASMKQALSEHRDHLFRQRAAAGLDLSRLATDLFDMQELVRDAPQRLSVLLRTLADNRFRIHVAGLEESRLIESIQKIANRVTAGVIAAAMIVGAALIMDIPTSRTLLGYPVLALLMFLVAAGLGAGLVISSLLGDRRTQPRHEKDPL
ncbi:ABC1 kinase family protein [Arenimonas terrae]|uniref:AarF/ABC1/UbiB kinase family protein n=1 Tax=Arenimonas terrae TaxID=2546226 RepID=A0A5C4RQM7_9GAMM|nr:AarF/UbiB family protein [Arenimonas terrae]TNJ33255.1 AarF/ABC1/UbiB kinase family protein [Arenimonas terrae]